MLHFLKNTFLLSAICITIFSCNDDDATNNNNQLMAPGAFTPTSTDLFNAEGTSINIRELQRRNPNFRIENLESTGASNVDLLTANQYRSITLEVVSIEGSEPEESSIESLIDFINQRLHKPDGVNVIRRSIASPGLRTYSTRQIFEEIEIPFRTQFNNDNNLSIFIFFADADNENTVFDPQMTNAILGTAYFNTSFVIYKSTLNRVVNRSPNKLTDVEAGTLRHEFAHLLGLVNIGTEMVIPHEEFQRNENGEIIRDSQGDPQGNGHCNVPNCLMEANSRLIRDMMGGLEVMDLDPLCIRDLQNIGGK